LAEGPPKVTVGLGEPSYRARHGWSRRREFDTLATLPDRSHTRALAEREESNMAGTERVGNGERGERIGVLGGTFDPPHIAHLLIAQEARARLGLDVVLFVPAGEPPHKRGHAISSVEDRCAMVRLAIEDEPGFQLSRVDVDRPGPSYTVETLRRLRAEYGPHATLDLIVGGDMLLDLPGWHDAAGVVAGADHIVVALRPGYLDGAAIMRHLFKALPALEGKLLLIQLTPLNISASEMRLRVAASMPVRYYVPDSVIAYIAEHGLYRASAGAAGTSDASHPEVRP
jgi:nicotinate-nucleotide adenylyltransferase